jgi:ankyrin repeat protein
MVKSRVINGGGNCPSMPCIKYDIDRQDEYGYTRLMIVIQNNKFGIAEELIEEGANLDLQDFRKKTALIHAIIYMPDIAEKLIEEGANLDLQDFREETALMHAIQNDNFDIAEKLIKVGANLDLQDLRKETALMHAINYHEPTIVELLIKVGANLDLQDLRKETALMHAIDYHEPTIVELLIKAGAGLDFRDDKGRTALMIAIIHRPDIAEKLIEAKAGLDIQDNYGNTALIRAISFKRTKVAEKLIEAGANLNLQDNYGNTALMHAIKYMPDIIKFIIDTVINHVNHVEHRHSDTYVNDFIVSNNLVNEMRKETLDMDIKRQFARPILAYTYSFHKFRQVMLYGMNLKRSKENKSIYSYSLDDPLSIVKSYISPEIYMYLKPDEEIEQIKNAYNYSNENSSVTKDEMDDYIQRIIDHDNSKKSGGKKRKTKKGKRGNKSKESRKGKKSRKERKSRKGKKI